MTMKHQRDPEAVEPSAHLLGSDHSMKKRQRTMSVSSEDTAIENKNSNINGATKASVEATFSKEIGAYSPRMMALLTSLEALDDKDQRQFQHQWPHGSAKAAPAAPLHASVSTTQAAAALLQQKQQQQYTSMGKPLFARPAIHKIEEHPPVQVSASQAKSNPLAAHAMVQVESRDASNVSPSVDSTAVDTIKRAVAAATAATNHTASTYTAVNAALEQHRIAGAALAAVASKSGTVFGHSPAIASTVIGTPLASFSFPAIASAPSTSLASTKYSLGHLNHGGCSPALQGPTTRQLAIHNAVHSDYKKIYKPLKRPPRLPTPHEALVVAAISTAAPTTSVCR